MRQVGIILGPLLIFWTKTWSFDLVGIKVDEFNSATLLIAFMWSIVLTLNLVATHYEPKATSRIGIIDKLALRRSLRFS